MKYLVYGLTSPSGKIYIGLTKQPDVMVRWRQHIQLWKSGKDKKGRKTKLQQAFSKYDPDTTEWVVQQLFETDSIEKVITKEIELIADFNSVAEGYNINPGGDLGSLGREFDEEHKQAISIGKKNWWDSEAGQEYKKVLSARFKENNPAEALRGKPPWNKGIEMKEETKAIVSQKMKEWWDTPAGKLEREKKAEFARELGKKNKGSTWSEERYNKPMSMSGREQTEHQKKAASAANSRVWIVTAPDGTSFEVSNLRQWCLDNNISASNVSRGGQRGYKAIKKDQ